MRIYNILPAYGNANPRILHRIEVIINWIKFRNADRIFIVKMESAGWYLTQIKNLQMVFALSQA